MSLAKQLNDPTLALAVTVLFAILAFWSLQPCTKYPLSDYCMDGGYTKHELQKRSNDVNAILFPEHRNQLMDVWNLTEADVAKPVDLWGVK